jgi:hypothetical protein
MDWGQNAGLWVYGGLVTIAIWQSNLLTVDHTMDGYGLK